MSYTIARTMPCWASSSLPAETIDHPPLQASDAISHSVHIEVAIPGLFIECAQRIIEGIPLVGWSLFRGPLSDVELGLIEGAGTSTPSRWK